jgi:hypothetical protein
MEQNYRSKFYAYLTIRLGINAIFQLSKIANFSFVILIFHMLKLYQVNSKKCIVLDIDKTI